MKNRRQDPQKTINGVLFALAFAIAMNIFSIVTMGRKIQELEQTNQALRSGACNG